MGWTEKGCIVTSETGMDDGWRKRRGNRETEEKSERMRERERREDAEETRESRDLANDGITL